MARSAFSSSTLLDEIVRRPLDPGYEAAARRREQDLGGPDGPDGGGSGDSGDGSGDGGHSGDGGSGDGGAEDDGGDRRRGGRGPVRRPRRGAVRRWQLTTSVVVAGVVLGLVAGAGVAQLRTRPLQAQDRAVLEAEIERRTERADALAESNSLLRQEIEAEQTAAIGEGAAQLLEDTERLAVVTGAVPVVGDGLVVVLDDAPSDGVEEPSQISDKTRVRDVDVQTVVNGLWAAGAEGISVNDQRLTSLSTIRHAGDAIVVDLRQLARPYTITAVGDPGTLQEEARTGSAGQWAAFLRDSYGIAVSVEVTDDLELPSASRLTLRHAEGVVGPGAVESGEGTQEEAGQS